MENEVKPTIKENIKSRGKWVRALAMIVFAFVAYVAQFLVFAIMIFQFVYDLFNSKTNKPLFVFGQSLSQYIRQIFGFILYETEQMPFPFSDWPK